ncbi:MAG: DUF58 domain-containing protein [Symbiobacteriia bacterium]
MAGELQHPGRGARRAGSAVVVSDWKVPLLAGGAFIFARLSGGSLPWFLFYALTGLILASWYWTRQLVTNVACRWDVPTRVLTVGEEAEIRLRIYNESWLPVPWLEARHELGRVKQEGFGCAIGPLGSQVQRLPFQATRRGFFPAGSVDLALCDPLGIFTGHRRLVSDRHLTVYPRALRLHRLPLALRQPYGHFRTRKRAEEDLTSLSQVRPWRSGDSPRHIHWKVTAHRGELQVREYELAATTEVYLVLDLYRHGHQGEGPEASAERAVEVVASLTRTILEQGLPVGLLAHGLGRLSLSPGQGLRQLHRVLEALVDVEASGLLPLADVLAEARRTFTPRSTVIAVTASLGRQLANQLLLLKGTGHGLLVVAVRPGGPTGADWEAAAAALQGEGVPLAVVHEAADLAVAPVARVPS